MIIDPATPSQWQIAVDAAKAALVLDAARQYGLVEGGPTVNVKRCLDILRKGRRRGCSPRPDAIERFMRELQG